MSNPWISVSASVFALIAAAPSFAATVLVTIAPTGSTSTTFTATGNNGFGNPGPVVVDGLTVTGNPQATYGNASYNLGNNGSWNNFSWVATNNESGSVTFDLGGNYSAVGGFINYYTSVIGSNPTITALNAGMGVIGTYDLATLAPISTPGTTNGGAFRGIRSTANDIRFFQISGSYIVAHALITSGAAGAVPEPATWGMMILGMGMVGGAIRGRQKVSTGVKFA